MTLTRSAAKRDAGEAPSFRNLVNAGVKRPADIIQTPEKTLRNKREKSSAHNSDLIAQESMLILPHGLGTVHQPSNLNGSEGKPFISNSYILSTNQKGMTAEELEKASKPRGLPKKTPENKYRLMPGATPFPDWPDPTAEGCQTVYDILVKEHEEKQKAREEEDNQRGAEDKDQETTIQLKKYTPLSFKPPAKIQPPSTTVAGCGEVPDLVDAMMRTIISQSVTRDSANKVVERIISRFGQLDSRTIGAGSINWNAVRLAPPENVIQTLHKGGLQNTKYQGIKGCLDMIHDENQVRRTAYLKEKETGEAAIVPGAAALTTGQKEHQLNKIKAGILTLDHIRAMSASDAMLTLVKYPQIGVKTAACILLFCLQIPSFAVDTHVHRMCKWLEWVPKTNNEDYVYMHCDLRIPDHLKYGLHQLFIEHGSGCHRCKGNTAKGTADWNKAVCPLEHLLTRHGKKESKLKTTKTVDIKKESSEKHQTREGPAETVIKEDTTQAMTDSKADRGERKL